MDKSSNTFLAPNAKALGLGLGLAAALGLAAPKPAAAASSPFASFVGNWSGSGQVVGTKGDRERIRCRAKYSEALQGEALNQTIVCASSSYRINVTSYVEASGSSVSGYWREETRDASGHLTGRIEDGRFNGTIAGTGFTAAVSLTSNGRTQAVSIRPQGGDIADVQIELERGGGPPPVEQPTTPVSRGYQH
jgi:hypothetical protein